MIILRNISDINITFKLNLELFPQNIHINTLQLPQYEHTIHRKKNYDEEKFDKIEIQFTK